MAFILNRSSVYFKNTNGFNVITQLSNVGKVLQKENKIVLHCPSKRNLSIHEFNSYMLLKEYGIGTPKFGVVKNKNEAKEIFKKLNIPECAVKAQVMSGGRKLGKFKKSGASGVVMASTGEEVEKLVGQMLGDFLVTKQTGAAGLPCNTVMITEKKDAAKEYYLAVLNDRKFNGPAVIFSAEGGVSIEEVAAKNPGAIFIEPIDIFKGVTAANTDSLCQKVGLQGKKAQQVADTIKKLFKMFIEKDATLLELNPFVEGKDGVFFTLDAKFKFDDSAEFRQKKLFELADPTQENPLEKAAKEWNLNYIQLDGTIGCVVNGAGLAMATMDILKLYGGDPANFLDVGGVADVKSTKFAIELIMNEKSVKVIFINIFGGIMRCDIIAEGLVAAAKTMKREVPLVVRLLGTKNDIGKEIIAKSKTKIMPKDDFEEAAKLAVKMAK